MVTGETARARSLDLAADASPTARIPVAVRVTVADPFEAYRRAREEVGGVYLATTGGQSGWGYFATTPADFREVDPGEGETLDALSTFLDGEELVRGGCEIPYPCGAVGWLSYDVARELETLPDSAARDRALPRLQVAAYDRIAAWEEPRGDEVTLRVTACPRLDDHESATVAYEFGKQHATELARRATEGDPAVGEPPVATDEAAFESDCTRESFADRVRTVKQYIRDGDTFQANVSQRLRAPAAVHPVEAFDALRSVNPAPYSALLEFPGVDLV
jgi:anthranilate synthase component 1